MTPHRCPVCGGRGTVPGSLYTGLTGATGTTWVMCRTCRGRGIVWEPAQESMVTDSELTQLIDADEPPGAAPRAAYERRCACVGRVARHERAEDVARADDAEAMARYEQEERER